MTHEILSIYTNIYFRSCDWLNDLLKLNHREVAKLPVKSWPYYPL